MSLKIAIVLSWFGKNVKGGAEQQAWQFASRLAARGVEVTAITTCSKDYFADWSTNHYEKGEYTEDNVKILRFPVRQRNRDLFEKYVVKLQSIGQYSNQYSPIKRIEEMVYLTENISSFELLEYLSDNVDKYDAFIFIPYLFPVAVKGVPRIKEKAILQPCLHDECYAYLNPVKDMFYDAKILLFNSQGEFELAKMLYGEEISQKSMVIGEGVEIDLKKMEEYLNPPVIDGEYILYLGRRETGKNTHLLIESFDEYVERTGGKLKLVLAGPADLPVKPKSDQIIDKGLVSEEEKINLLKYCKALVNPSVNESFSRVIFEAWFSKKPIIVHKECLATYKALEAAGFAGWYAEDKESFTELFTDVENAGTDILSEMAEKGLDYAKNLADWDIVVDKYIKTVENLKLELSQKEPIPHYETLLNKNIKIVLTYFTIHPWDAVGIDNIIICDLLREQGFDASLYAENFTDELKKYMITKEQLLEIMKDENNIIIYQQANNWKEGEELIENCKAKLFMKYHNVTPKEFFEPYSSKSAYACLLGKEQTERLVKSGKFYHYLACSPYNAKELEKFGANSEDISVSPPFNRIHNFDRINVNPDLFGNFLNDKINLLFVGRLAPNKGHKYFIEIMKSYVKLFDRNIVFHIVGGLDPSVNAYYEELQALIHKYGLQDVISFKMHINPVDLNTYYKACDIFVLMSEHEGFCVPILEAQYHKIPIIALDRCAVKYTLGENQIIFHELDYDMIAGAINVIYNNKKIYQYLIDEGYKNFLKYEKEVIFGDLLKFLQIEKDRAQKVEKKKIAWVSPMPPQKSGISNYSYVIIKELKKYYDIELFYDIEPEDEVRNEFWCFPLDKLRNLHKKYHQIIYHIGNSVEFHKNLYKVAWDVPGITVLHDYNIHGFITEAFLKEDGGRLFKETIIEGYGAKGEYVWNIMQIGQEYDPAQFPMAHGIVNKSKKTIVHSEWLKTQFENKNVFVIPHFAKLNHIPKENDVKKFRESYNIKPTDFVISCLGFINFNKLPDVQAQAIKKLVKEGYQIKFIFAGESGWEVKSLENEIKDSEYKDNFIFTGYLNDSDYHKVIFASDLIINLRFPSMGESSGTLLHSLAAGKPVIVSDYNQYKEFPDDVCPKIPLKNPIEHLYKEIKNFIDNRELLKTYSEKAKEYSETLSIEKICEEYKKVIE
ncbi:MAG: hypothetical protein A2086_16800 [Spirochaetes bacterium GWD1_27_9]|nr:MAG: hypothetical protein A2Z98_01930 [Spirochaetes bacterium GWB1_27_13]OHD24996.1 MAG: hypothetical protein A2Y34_13525 [Spirochaetes bacterium GWC1_27_15]OHD43443.1 MAG: hypothetical protein A2086_16800 [Spirochaetes bacterium GWD1_27_9]